MKTETENEDPAGCQRSAAGHHRQALLVVAIAALLWTLIGAAGADASTYKVRACWDGHRSKGDAVFQTSHQFSDYTPANFCGSFNSLQIRNGGGVNATGETRWGQWVYAAPAGTVFTSSTLYLHAAAEGGHRALLFYKPTGSGQTNLHSGTTANREFTTGAVNHAYIGAGLACIQGNTCPQNNGVFAQLSDIRMNVADVTAPTTPTLGGALFSGGWKSGAEAFSVAAADQGAGIDKLQLAVNGATATLADYCSPRSHSGWLETVSPCASLRTFNGGRDTSSPPFHEGPDNLLTACALEYGTNPQKSCRSVNVKVDNAAPAAPLGFSVAQGSEWQRLNDFDLSWSNPVQAHAPIAGARVRISRPGYDSGWVTYGGTARRSVNDLKVPEPGEYTVETYLYDSAGNGTPASAVSRTIRFDDVPPEGSRPDRANGWLGRSELASGYQQEWAAPRIPHPISGIKGYAFVVDHSPSTDPCDIAGVGGANVECSTAEINFPGLGNRSTTLGGAEFEEGNNWVHVVPVSGSRVKAEEIEHTRLRVDTVNPTVELGGAPQRWSRQAVNLTAAASDERSGMVDNDDYPDDAPPATFLEIDGATRSEPGASASASLSGDGVHRVNAWARDLAGNTSAKKPAQVKIDGTEPLAFLEREDANDPELIAGRVVDNLSGIAAARLHYREGDRHWVELDSTLKGGRVTARMDSTQMKDGTSYLFRVTATDRAGNEISSTQLEDGDQRKQVGPLRGATKITDLAINDKRGAANLRYGKRAQLTGKLVDARGRSVSGAAVDVVQAFAAGSRRDRTRTAVRSNGHGVFSMALPKGPSRQVAAHFRGDRRLLKTASKRAVRLNVRGRVKLKVSTKRIEPGSQVRFGGKIGRKGAKIPAGGKLVEIQVKVGPKWNALKKAIRTNGKGRFQLSYRFGRFYDRKTTFRFRARVLKESAWPYRPVRSKPQKVTIVP